MLEGIRLGKSPATPVKVTKRIVTQEAAKADGSDPLDSENRMAARAATAIRGITANAGQRR